MVVVMSTSIAGAFIPVADPATSATWYASHLGLEVVEVAAWSAVLSGRDGANLTLMGPSSGIAVQPGIDWASCNFRVADLELQHARLAGRGLHVSPVEGDPEVCRFFTTRDPDGNILLVTDR